MTEKTRVVNLRKERFDVYIGRKTWKYDGYFGNPFLVREYGREGCLEKYREYFEKRLVEDKEFKQRIHELKGKVLGCFCKPEACHGDIIAEYLDGKSEQQGGKKSEKKSEYVVMLEDGVYLAPWSGYSGRTIDVGKARRYKTERGATIALGKARKYSEFKSAKVLEV